MIVSRALWISFIAGIALAGALSACATSDEPPGPAAVAQCYWLSNEGAGWVARSDSTDAELCFEMDSCSGGVGLSGGGCYKWATGANAPAVPWTDLGFTQLSGPLEPPLEAGYYVYDGFRSGGCGDNQSPVTFTSDVALYASRDPSTPVVATARDGEAVNIVDCRVHFRPRRGEVLRTDYGFEAGQPAYMLYSNEWEWDVEYFEHNEVIDYVWYQGEIIEVLYETPEDLFSWEPIGPGMSRRLRDSAGAGCWYQLETHGVRGWGQSADLDCYWTRR